MFDDSSPTEVEPRFTYGLADQLTDLLKKLPEPPGGRPWLLYGLCGASLFGNVVLGGALLMSGDDQPVATVAVVPPIVDEVPAIAAPAEVVEPVAPVAIPSDVNVVRGAVEGSLARTFQNVAPADHAAVLSAVTARLFFFDLDLRSDLQRGDDLRVAYTWDGALAHVTAASYGSKKLGQTLAAYEFAAEGDAFPSYWSAEGEELAPRLVDSPIDGYEQITSLLKDRPKHKGMDFKTPEGTEIHSPRAGVVTRVNWNWSNNGNCVEVRFADGVVAKFLHLSRADVTEGAKVSKGALLGATGNTGHSTAPHLHYQLERGDTVVDPIDYHGTTRRSLSESDRVAFESEKARLDQILATSG
jgi:murein DD-endopeptidase